MIEVTSSSFSILHTFLSLVSAVFTTPKNINVKSLCPIPHTRINASQRPSLSLYFWQTTLDNVNNRKYEHRDAH